MKSSDATKVKLRTLLAPMKKKSYVLNAPFDVCYPWLYHWWLVMLVQLAQGGSKYAIGGCIRSRGWLFLGFADIGLNNSLQNQKVGVGGRGDEIGFDISSGQCGPQTISWTLQLFIKILVRFGCVGYIRCGSTLFLPRLFKAAIFFISFIRISLIQLGNLL